MPAVHGPENIDIMAMAIFIQIFKFLDGSVIFSNLTFTKSDSQQGGGVTLLIEPMGTLSDNDTVYLKRFL